MLKIICILCGTKDSMKIVRYSVNSWHGFCESCGRTIGITEISEDIEEIQRITKIMTKQRGISEKDIEDYGPETGGD